jgi:hypothetical protein
VTQFLKVLPYLTNDNVSNSEQEVMGRTNSPTFPTYNLFEVPEPNLTELNLSELTSTSFISTQFNRIYCSIQLGCHGYHGT